MKAPNPPNTHRQVARKVIGTIGIKNRLSTAIITILSASDTLAGAPLTVGPGCAGPA